MSYDILTERGKQAADDQHAAVFAVLAHHSDLTFAHTATRPVKGRMSSVASAVDGIFLRGGVMVSCAEVRSRDMSLDELWGRFNGEWLLTCQKLDDLRLVSSLLRIPGIGILYLIKSDVVLLKRLCDDSGQLTCEVRVAETETQANCNGGTALRVNAYIDMHGAKEYTI